MSDPKEGEGTVIMARPDALRKQARRREACIILLHPAGPDIGRRTPLERSRYTLGRKPGVDLIIDRNSVSRIHARLERDERGGWVIEDLGSTNGTFVNEQRIAREVLRDGDQIRLGDAIFKFLSGANVESAYHEEIYRMTIVDGLTGVHNQRYFLDFLDREVASAHRHGQPLSLVMMDLDHFKVINDDHGHLAGDSVLKEVAARLETGIRYADLFARYGGEEFAAILRNTPLQGAIRYAESVRLTIANQPFSFNEISFSVTASLGVTTLHDEPAIDADALIKRADDNLFEAKRRGRNRCVPSLTDLDD